MFFGFCMQTFGHPYFKSISLGLAPVRSADPRGSKLVARFWSPSAGPISSMAPKGVLHVIRRSFG